MIFLEDRQAVHSTVRSVDLDIHTSSLTPNLSREVIVRPKTIFRKQ